jgi:hypothetical protein
VELFVVDNEEKCVKVIDRFGKLIFSFGKNIERKRATNKSSDQDDEKEKQQKLEEAMMKEQKRKQAELDRKEAEEKNARTTAVSDGGDESDEEFFPFRTRAELMQERQERKNDSDNDDDAGSDTEDDETLIVRDPEDCSLLSPSEVYVSGEEVFVTDIDAVMVFSRLGIFLRRIVARPSGSDAANRKLFTCSGGITMSTSV